MSQVAITAEQIVIWQPQSGPQTALLECPIFVVALPPKSASAEEWAIAHGPQGRGAVLDMPETAVAVPSFG